MYAGVRLDPEDRPKWLEKVRVLRSAVDSLKNEVSTLENSILQLRYESAMESIEAVVNEIENMVIGDHIYIEHIINTAAELGRLACQFSTLLPPASEIESWYRKPSADELARAERIQRDLGFILDDLVRFLAIEIGFNLDAGEGECIIKPKR